MPLLTILAAVALAPQTQTVILRRFETVNPYADFPVQWSDKAYTYMDSADTYLSPDLPDANFGASPILRLGRGNVILLQFGQLNRAIVRGSKILSAKLVLHPVPGRFPEGVPVQVFRVTREWRDGGADGEPMYWTATHRAALSSPRANAVRWQSPGAAGPLDRLPKPSAQQLTSEGYTQATNTWTIEGEGITNDVAFWFGKHYRNYGWAIVAPGDKRLDFYSSDQMVKDLRPALVVTYQPLLTEGEQKGVDLNVTFIERTPRYLRYHDDGVKAYERKPYRDDNPGIMKYPVNGDTQKFPNKGNLMTYTAHVKNSGFETYFGQLEYVWRYNGEVIERGAKTVRLDPEQSTTLAIKRPWTGELDDLRDEKLELEIDPAGKIEEITKNNNAQSKYCKARTWKYWVERSAYAFQKQYLNAYGSYSYEDYLKWHENVWNETYLDKSRFDGLAPDGARMRVTLDDFEIVDDGRLGGGIHRLDDKPDFHFDGEWGTEWVKGKDAQNPDAVNNLKNFMRAQRILLETSLLHEASHQVLGDFDQYWSNIEPSEPNDPRGKCKVKDGGPTYITRGAMYAYPGLMGGDDTRPNPFYTEGTGLYSAHSIIGYNANTRYRNGFFGEWQYDLPRSISVRLLAADGTPMPGSEVKIWQFSDLQIVDRNVVASGLRPGQDGVLKLPDQDSGEDSDVTTATGHTLLKKNPFGRIDVVGVNTVLLLKIDAFGQTDYRFINVMELNKAYARGYKDRYTLDLRTQISPCELDWHNLARGCAVETVLNPAEAGKLTDGDPKSVWRVNPSPAGSFLQLDLGKPRDVARLRLMQSESHGSFFPRFKIEASNDPSFRTGVSELNRQFNVTFSIAMINDRDISPADPAVRWVDYGCRPTAARYIRITSLQDTGWSSLSEIEVFGKKG